MSFKEFLSESFNNPVEFDLTEDTNMPREIYAIFKINGTDYGCSLVQTKYDKVYSLEAYRIVTKKKRFWSYKSVADMRPFLATIIKFMESVYPFIKQKMDGIIIDLPNGADSEKYVKFLELIINKFYIKTYRAIPIVKKTEKAGNYLLVTKKVIKPETIFKTAAFHKHFDFTGIPDAEAFDTIKEPFKKIKPTVNMTIDPRYVFKSLALDNMTDETLAVFDAEPETDIEETEFDLSHIKKNGKTEAITIADYYKPEESKKGNDDSKELEESDITWTKDLKMEPGNCNPFLYVYYKTNGTYYIFDIFRSATKQYLKLTDPSFYDYDAGAALSFKKGMELYKNGETDEAKKLLSDQKILLCLHDLTYEIRYIRGNIPSKIDSWIYDTGDFYLDTIDPWNPEKIKNVDINYIVKQLELIDYFVEIVRSLIGDEIKDYYTHQLLHSIKNKFDTSWLDKVKYTKDPSNIDYGTKNITVSSIKTPEMKSPENSPFAYGNDDVYPPNHKLGLTDAPYNFDENGNKVDYDNTSGLTLKKKKYLSEMPGVGDFLYKIDTWYGVDNDYNYPNKSKKKKPEKPPYYASYTEDAKYKTKMQKYAKEIGFDSGFEKNMLIFRNYTGSSSSYYNEMFRESIRDGKHPLKTGNWDEYEDIRNAVYWALENAPILPEPIWVYRNFSFNGIRDKKPGEFLIDPGFMSTTISTDMAYGNSRGRMKIFLPKGARIIPMLDSSENAGEEEIILLPFSNLKIMKKFQTEDKTSFICYYTGTACKAYFDYTSQYDKNLDDFDLRESKTAHVTLPSFDEDKLKKWNAPLVDGNTMKRLEKMIREGFGKLEKDK